MNSPQEGLPRKIIYLAPIKTLCSERYIDWKQKFQYLSTPLAFSSFTLDLVALDLSCHELTGDSDNQVDFRSLVKHDIILTTPEKWDSITRKWKEIAFFLKEVAMLIIDEVHMLNETRGATLEAVVSRMKMLNRERNSQGKRPIRYKQNCAIDLPTHLKLASWRCPRQSPTSTI